MKESLKTDQDRETIRLRLPKESALIESLREIRRYCLWKHYHYSGYLAWILKKVAASCKREREKADREFEAKRRQE